MSETTNKDGMKVHLGSTILYCMIAALIGFVIRAESQSQSVEIRIAQLERRTDTLETDLKAIKESLYEIKGDVKLLIKGTQR